MKNLTSCAKVFIRFIASIRSTNYKTGAGSTVSASMPHVSVIVPAFNYARFLGEALHSVSVQTFSDWECLVVDDGSTDDTPDVVARAAAEDSRIRYYRQTNSGLAATRNEGLTRTSGAYVQFLDADDRIAPEKLERQLAVFADHPKTDVCCSNYQPYDSGSGEILARFSEERLGNDPLRDFLFRWERGLCIPIHAALFRRGVWNVPRPFDERLPSKEDWLMWIDLALGGCRFRFLDEDLTFYRMHDANMFKGGTAQSLAFLQAALIAAPRLPEGLRWPFLEETRSYVSEVLTAQFDARDSSAEERIVALMRERRDLAVERDSIECARSESILAWGKAAPPAGCTIVARNYLSHARIVAESYLEHHPGSRFYVLVADGDPEDAALLDTITLLPSTLCVPHLHEMCVRYGVIELCTALKPHFLAYLLNERSEPSVLYLDPDVWVHRPLLEAARALETADVVLTPHALTPIPLDGRRPDESAFLTTGAYNLGFLGVRRGPTVDALLEWQIERFRDRCRIATYEGLFVDQKWADLIPSYIRGTSLLRDETYNVAYWNLHERAVQREGNRFLVNGRPLAFFHFSGLDLDRGQFNETHHNRTAVEPDSALAELVAAYQYRHRANGREKCRAIPWAYSHFSNGVPWNSVLRALFLALPTSDRVRFGNPFRADGKGSFFDWALIPDTAGLSPFVRTLYGLRLDVRKAFPDAEGADRERLLEWARTSGARETGYAPEFVSAP
jgi:hypothetical protein